MAVFQRDSTGENGRSSAFPIAVILMIGAFVMAGGARDDIVSLMVWRAISAFLLALAIVFHGATAWRRGKALMLCALGIIALVCLHLVPLPPLIWTSLPGRGIVVSVYRAAGMDLPWQPLSMAQARTWNALFSLMAPLAMLIVGLALPEHRHRQLLYVLLSVGLLSGIIGLIQAIGPAYGPLYFYEITNNGTSVGLFANRNHQAAMLATLLPLLAANLSMFKGTPDKLFFYRSFTFAVGALVVPLLLMTGSRAGILLGFIGAGCAWWVYRSPEATGRVVGIRGEHRSRLVGLGIAGITFLVLAVIALRTPALGRLLETDPASELRVQALPVVLDSLWKYFPFGSGIGTFVEAYQLGEPDALISDRYFNHAHDDFLELLMTGGVLALLLLIWVLALAALAGRALFKGRDTKRGDPAFAGYVLGRAGFSVLAILAVASVTDYPLRVPSVIVYATLASVWCSNATRVFRKNARK